MAYKIFKMNQNKSHNQEKDGNNTSTAAHALENSSITPS